MLDLLVIQPGREPRRVPLGDKPVTVGSLALNTVAVSHPGIAREHVTFSAHGADRVRLAVAPSVSPVLVNGRSARSATLDPGDQVQVGPALIVVQNRTASPDSTEGRDARFAIAEKAFALAEQFEPGLPARRALGQSLDLLVELFGAERGLVLDVEGAGKSRVAARRGEWPAGEAPVVSKTLLARLAASSRPLLIASVASDAALSAVASLSVAVKSVVAGPLLVDGTLVGVVYLESPQEAPAFGDPECRFLERFARFAVHLLQRARATDELEAEAGRLRELSRRETEGAADLEALVGASEVMQSVRRQIRQVAPTDITTLILGESGTGKELVARALHGLSPRAGRPLVAVNCTALPDELVESELFGHVAGAFSGAQRDRLGRFELAHTGTLFLDEIGDLSMTVQAKLLRALQEKVITRVGEAKDRPVDVRIVAATNAPLPQRIREGRFREDLFFRLGVFTIPLPPLRERTGDVPGLARAFVRRFAAQIGRPVDGIDDEAMAALQAYSWPGNVRELHNLMQQAVVREGGTRIHPASLVFALAGDPLGAPPSTPAALPDFGPHLELAAARFERWFLEQALEAAHGDVSIVVARTGLSRATFYRKCAALSLDPARHRRPAQRS